MFSQKEAMNSLVDFFLHNSTTIIFHDSIAEKRLTETRNKLIYVLAAREVESSLIEMPLSLYGELGPEGQIRLLTSAELGAFIQRWYRKSVRSPEQLAAEFLDLVVRESLILATQSGVARENPVWSPMGDRYIDETGNTVSQPMVGGCITVDFGSPLSRLVDESSSVFGQRYIPMTQKDRDVVVEKFGRALALVDEITPMYGHMIRTWVKRIFVRKSVRSHGEDGTSTAFILSSEHMPKYIYTIGFGNPQLPEKSILSLAEGLIHEAVHSFLAGYEDVYGDFCSSDVSYRPVSQWSGRPIASHSIVHAMCVYLACHEFMVRLRGHVFAHEHADLDSRLLYIASGFTVRHLPSTRLATPTAIPPHTSYLVDEIHRRMFRFYSTARELATSGAGEPQESAA
ncbi:HEXXH motif-containing putative peptide modification protein [Luteibacter aegosomatis]|uniref:aKG-HExxH-type peptide beta-hydroxylase n=1 Tax=Luteibacter aegosomatis TaxID=2911537 RepID=UPI001FF8A648|nr:HEXXH motif-containing putative peptide modification protein [Luteibacter aegosomatis]UPG87454.1 HEXXH motif-containing putative peptide modification protein [Luteibacter aegosomatis]